MKTKFKYTFDYNAVTDEYFCLVRGLPGYGTIAVRGASPDEALASAKEAVDRVLSESENPRPRPDGGVIEVD